MKNRSTGPRSPEGKSVSRMNALKTGIYAKGEVILPGENVRDLETLTAEYYDSFHPTTPEQRCLVDSLISDEWLLRRFRIIEAQDTNRRLRRLSRLDMESPLSEGYEINGKLLERLQRRINATRRNFRQTLELLQKLQAAACKTGTAGESLRTCETSLPTPALPRQSVSPLCPSQSSEFVPPSSPNPPRKPVINRSAIPSMLPGSIVVP